MSPTAHSTFPKNNDTYVANFGDKGTLALPPAKRLAVVSCMDARIDVNAQLGLKEGDAHVIRNAGGSAKDSVRSLVISQRLLGTREIAVFHHTDCGMVTFTTETLRKQLKEANSDEAVAGAADLIDFLEFPDWEEAVKSDVKFLQDHPLILKDTIITGWIYHVENGKVRQVV